MTHTTTLSEDARRLQELDEQYSEAKALSDDLKKQRDRLEFELIQRMEDESVDGIKTDGINFVPTETIYGSVQDRAAFVEWAEQHDAELLEKKERKALINALVREHTDNGQPLPPGLAARPVQYISKRAA